MVEIGVKSLSNISLRSILLSASCPDSPTSPHFVRLVYRLRLSNPLISHKCKAPTQCVGASIFVEMGGFEPPSENGHSYESTVRRSSLDLNSHPQSRTKKMWAEFRRI